MKTPVSSFLSRVKMRWQLAGMNDRVELTDGVLGACRHEKVQPKIAGLAIIGLLVGQTILPGAMLISNVQAEELRQSNFKKAEQKAIDDNTPAWAKMLEKRTQQEKRERELRLLATAKDDNAGARAQLTQGRGGKGDGDNGFGRPPVRKVPGSKPGDVLPSADLECEDCDTDVRALDLRKVPTEKELRRAGQLGGALTPTRSAKPEELGLKLDKLMKKAGVEGGLRAQLPKKDPRERGLQRAKAKYARAQAINLDFGKAIQEWNKHNYRQAAGMFEKHLKDYPESAWAGEARLHLGCDAKYNGRFAQAQTIYNDLLAQAREKPNPQLKQKKKERRQRGGAPDEAEINAEVDKAARGAGSLDEAVEKLDVASEDDDESFDIHMKALARWADLDIATGQWNSAAKKLQDIIARDGDWRRRTWAQSWLTTLTNLGPQAKRLAMCGPQALQYVLAGLDKESAANKVGAIVPKTIAGLSLAEMETLSKQNGATMTAFKIEDEASAKMASLAELPLPAIVHTEAGRGFDEKNSYLADHELKRAPLVAVHPDALKKGVLPAKVAQSMKADKGGAAQPLPADIFGTQLPTTGHYLVLENVDAKTRQARLFDPSAKRFYQLSWTQLAQQWSGKGLALGSKTRLASLSKQESQETRGGCCGSFEPPTGPGDHPNNIPICPDGGCVSGPGSGSGPPVSRSPKGEPLASINRTNLNVYVRDIPLWHTPGKGPAVEIDMSYNSQDGLTQRNAFGNKWMFNYGMYVVEDTQAGGGQVLGVMGDGSVDRYYPDGNGGYTTQSDNLNRLSKLGATRYELTFPDDSVALFDIPAGTTSLQPFLLELRDRWGYKLTFGYDAQVQLTTITDALGQVTTLRYDAAGHVTRVFDPWGRHASFSYDANGNLVECIDMEGHAFQYTYGNVYNGTGDWQDESVYLTQLNTALGPYLFTHSYGYPDRNVTITDPMGYSETFHGEWWGPDNYSYTDKKGASQGYSVAMTTSYNARVSQERLPDGTTTNKSIDPQTGWTTSSTDARNNTTSFTRNNKGKITSKTDPKGNTWTYSFASNSLDVTSTTNPNGVQTSSTTYNSNRQPISMTDESGTQTFSYTNWGALAGVTYPSGKTLNHVYNTNGRKVRTDHNGTAMRAYTYDEIGRVKTDTDELGLTLTYHYNNLDAIIKTVYPDGTTQETDYTCCKLPGIVKDRAGRKTYYDYDPLKRLVRVQDPAGNTLQRDFDKNGNVVRLIDSKGNLTKWQYDAMDRAIEKKYHDGTTEAYSYAGGLLNQSKGARGQIVGYGYDANANLTGINYPNTADVAMSYNALDEVAQVTDATGTHTFSYNNFGRLTALDGPFANDHQNFTYDALQRIQNHGVQRGQSGGTQSQSYSYDSLDRLSSLISNGTQGVGTFSYNYVGLTGMLSRLDLPNGTQTVQSYDALQRLTDVVNEKTNGTDLNKFAYAYDNRQVRTGVQMQYGSDPLRQVDYVYDIGNQMVGEVATGGVAGSNYSNAFSYDAMGNRLKRETTQGTNTSITRSGANALNLLTSVSTSLNGGPSQTSGLSYDAAGNLTEATTAGGGRTLYIYDDVNRLFRIEKRDATDAPVSKSEFIYDYASRKAVSREFTYTDGAWAQTSEKRRVYSGMDVVQERNELNEVTAQIVRQGNIGGILARSTNAGASFFGYDGNGNVTLLTDETGNEVGRYRYDAFGNSLDVSTGRAAENPYRFSTKELHGASGLYDYGYRFYSTSMGRWINRDPIDENGGANLYHFLANSPANNRDEYGECLYCLLAFGVIVLAGLSGCGGKTPAPKTPPPAPKPKVTKANICKIFAGPGMTETTLVCREITQGNTPGCAEVQGACEEILAARRNPAAASGEILGDVTRESCRTALSDGTCA